MRLSLLLSSLLQALLLPSVSRWSMQERPYLLLSYWLLSSLPLPNLSNLLLSSLLQSYLREPPSLPSLRGRRPRVHC